MVKLSRAILPSILNDLKEKMVFVSGPRQVGKTVLAREVLELSKGVYFTWDKADQRKTILSGRWPEGVPLVVLDEIHKYRKWKSFLKGEYDVHREQRTFLVTGSARLDIYRRGGDSLQGRYHSYRLHPFSVAELTGSSSSVAPGSPLPVGTVSKSETGVFKDLLAYGGFPEPFLKADDRFARRWRHERVERVINEDVRDLSTIHDLSALNILAGLLPERVGSPLSLNNLRMDLETSHRSIVLWMDILDSLYHTSRLPPFSGKLATAIRKERKLYLWDWGAVAQPGPRFENLVHGHLLKFVHYWQDVEGFKTDLHYVRDMAGREVDFLVTVDRRPWFAVEAKLTPTDDHHLNYFGDRLNIPHRYLVFPDGPCAYVSKKVHHVPAPIFFQSLGV